MNQIIATAQQILDFKVGAISVGSVIQGLILLIIFNRIISMIMGPLIDKILDRFKLETTVRGFVKALVKVILNFVALCVVAESIGIPIASVLAVVGMLGLAISLSVQGALSNVSNGFLILVTKPFKVGDYVAIAGIEGFVKEVSMLCTKVLTIDNKLIIVPNSEAMGGKITLENERIVSGEPVADLHVVSSTLHGCEISGDLIPTLIDEIPVIAVMASAAVGTTTIRISFRWKDTY